MIAEVELLKFMMLCIVFLFGGGGGGKYNLLFAMKPAVLGCVVMGN